MATASAALRIATDAGGADWAQARRFLSLLSGGDPFAQFTFQTFGENKSLNRRLHGTFAQHASALSSLNDRGASICVMVNEGNGRGRKAENVIRVRALFADFDGASLAPLDEISCKPHIIVESSLDKWHAYWLVDGLALTDFRRAQEAIAARCGSDPSIKDLPRVMRVPGFFHLKGKPFLTRIAEAIDAPAYSGQEILDLFIGPAQLEARPTSTKHQTIPDIIPEGERNDTLFRMAAGFVSKGLSAQAVNNRMQKINADRCNPPLGADEVDLICASALAKGSAGFTYIAHALSDSAAYRALPPHAVAILLAFYRKHDGGNNGQLSVTWDEIKGTHGFASKQAFREHLANLVSAGLLLKTSEAKNGQRGRIPAKYAIPDEFLPPSFRKGRSEALGQGPLRGPL